MPIIAIETDRSKVDFVTWDAFAKKCASSFRCSYFASRAWQIDDGWMFTKLRNFEFYIDCDRLKIGQCAIGISDHIKIFADALQVLPGYSNFWQDMMCLLLEKLGPGRYQYGSLWNIEQPREYALQRIDGVRVDVIEGLPIQTVDFALWENWNHYFAAVSNNARRSAKRALKQIPPPRIRVRQGLSTLLDVITLTRLHSRTASRKNMNSPVTRILLRNILRTITMRRHAVTAIVRVGGRAAAAFAGIEFGEHTYYMLGGSRADNGGAAWLLMLTMIRRAYERTGGAGKFLMGAVRSAEPGWENLSRSREQCRVVEYQSSTVTFTYSVREPVGKIGTDGCDLARSDRSSSSCRISLANGDLQSIADTRVVVPPYRPSGAVSRFANRAERIISRTET